MLSSGIKYPENYWFARCFLPAMTAGNLRRTSLCRPDAAGRTQCRSGKGNGNLETENIIHNWITTRQRKLKFETEIYTYTG